jgi:ABC-2 type transport system ATP-binding protein
MVDCLLDIRDLNVVFDEKQILQDVSFQLYKGQITALIGPNGAGKSTSMRVLGGFVKPQSGSYSFKGNEDKDFQKLRKHSGYLIESPGFYKYLTAEQNLKILQSIRQQHKSIDELLQLVGLDNTGKKKVSQYSKGMKQRLGIAQALIGNPDIIVLDEPFHGLDIEVKELLMQVVKELAHKENKAILISSHLLSDLEKIADNFVLLNNGRVHYTGSVHQMIDGAQEVRFYFSDEHAEKALESIGKKEQGVLIDSKCFMLMLDKQGSAEVLKSLVEHDLVPFKVEHVSSLQQKYMEIAE